MLFYVICVQIFKEIGAIEPLKKLASSTNKLASKFAAQALEIIGEEVPYKLSQQVPLWTPTDVQHWLNQVRRKNGHIQLRAFCRVRKNVDFLIG